ncbi:hypothetical protein MVEN_00265200 [Mycena venus]|uniref:Uncharacterized protein n=1 Tax=Mycena venus TaxID=2733690 RepID=A0A8H6Z3V2_9AGAR|nr:hypothetical protein MVEN_00265200 [Mycena venus]
MAERSTSRSRDAVASSGRGGLGNIRPASTPQDRSVGGPDDFSSTRGREPAVAISEVRSTGRGGAGNFRSPSRDPVGDRDVRGATEREVIRAHEERDREAPLASPSPTRTNSQGQVHSSGRGGAGNIAPGPAPPYERGRSAAVDGIHSTGRGGIANLTSSPAPPPEQVVHHAGAYESSGRGGAGNFSRSRERTASQERERSGSKDRAGGIAGLWNRMHGHGHGHGGAAGDDP